MKSALAAVLLCFLAAAPLVASSPADDYTGLYSFLKDNESIQLNVQDGKLDGWVSSFGLLESDSDTLSDRFFSSAELQGDQIHFITKQLHGCWLEFRGRIERGPVRTRAQAGYYQLVGTLTEYIGDADGHVSAQQRSVVFKSFPQSDAAQGKR